MHCRFSSKTLDYVISKMWLLGKLVWYPTFVQSKAGFHLIFFSYQNSKQTSSMLGIQGSQNLAKLRQVSYFCHSLNLQYIVPPKKVQEIFFEFMMTDCKMGLNAHCCSTKIKNLDVLQNSIKLKIYFQLIHRIQIYFPLLKSCTWLAKANSEQRQWEEKKQ